MRLHSIEVKTEHGICEIFLTEQGKKNIEFRCKSNCLECDNRCEFGYQAAEMLVI